MNSKYERIYSVQASKEFTKNLEHKIKSIVLERKKIFFLISTPRFVIFPCVIFCLLHKHVGSNVSSLIEVITIKGTKNKLGTNPCVTL